MASSSSTRSTKSARGKAATAAMSAGLKDKLIIIMGGAAVKKEDAEAIGALFGKNKEEGVEIVKKAVAGK